MAAPLLRFPPPPCVYSARLQPQDKCHLGDREKGYDDENTCSCAKHNCTIQVFALYETMCIFTAAQV